MEFNNKFHSRSKSRNKKILRCFICHNEGNFKRNCLDRKKRYKDREIRSTNLEASVAYSGYHNVKALTVLNNYWQKIGFWIQYVLIIWHSIENVFKTIKQLQMEWHSWEIINLMRWRVWALSFKNWEMNWKSFKWSQTCVYTKEKYDFIRETNEGWLLV